MGHDIHFLERLQEVEAPHVDTAMALYKDPELLRAVLGHLDLPEDAPRVALSLADPVRGPFLVVQRDGHFITCLRDGMITADLPIVPRGRLDAIVGRIESLRERWAAAVALTGGKNVSGRLMKRLASAGQGLSREEFLAVSAVQPLMLDSFYEILGKALSTLASFRSHARRPGRARHMSADLLGRYWNLRCLVGHLTVLFAMDCQDFLKTAEIEPEDLFRRFVIGLWSFQRWRLPSTQSIQRIVCIRWSWLRRESHGQSRPSSIFQRTSSSSLSLHYIQKRPGAL